MKNFDKWLDRFIDEKGLDLDQDLGDDQNIGFTLETLVCFMKTAKTSGKKQIRDKLVMIDFRNGDVMHYFKFLAKIVQENY